MLGTVKKPIILELYSDKVDVFPNPFEDNLTVKFNTLESQIITVQLYNLASQLLFNENFKVVKGSNSLKISPKVATGTYLLVVKMKEGSVTIKIVKK